MKKIYYTLWHVIIVAVFFIRAYLIQLFTKDPLQRRQRFTRNTTYIGRKLLNAFNIKLNINNPERLQWFEHQNYLIIANHVSYLDIIILSSILNVVYITSVEMGASPFLGNITRLGGSLFTNRKKFVSLPKEIENFSKTLSDGFTLVLFPEGTSTNGEKFREFRKSLFQIAIKSQIPLFPICIKYKTVDGKPFSAENRDIVCWYGDMTFTPHFMKLVTRKIEAEVHLLEPVPVDQTSTRQVLSDLSYNQLWECYTRET